MDADEAQTPMLETPAPTYGAVPEAAPVARRPRKALVAALGGAGLLLAAVAVARAPSHEAIGAPSTSSFSMTPGVGIGAQRSPSVEALVGACGEDPRARWARPHCQPAHAGRVGAAVEPMGARVHLPACVVRSAAHIGHVAAHLEHT